MKHIDSSFKIPQKLIRDMTNIGDDEIKSSGTTISSQRDSRHVISAVAVDNGLSFSGKPKPDNPSKVYFHSSIYRCLQNAQPVQFDTFVYQKRLPTATI